MEAIEPGYCHCGCGQKTKISPKTSLEKGWAKGEYRDFIHGHNARGANHPRWCNGRKLRHSRSKTYVSVLRPEHPRSVKGFVLEHIVVAESVLGKMLPPKAVIHHVDEDGQNNSKSNLVICQDDAYHKLIHKRKRALDACGHPEWIKCNFCKKWDSPENLFIYPDGSIGIHSQCNRDYQKKRRIKNAR